MKNLLLILSPIIFLFSNLHAQQIEIIDSLKSELSIARTDSARFFYASELFWEHINTQPDTAFAYAFRAIDLSKKMKKLSYEARGLNNISIYYRNKGMFSKADSALQLAIALQQQVQDTAGLAASYGNLANLYDAKSDFEKTISINLKASALYEQLQDTLGMGICLNNIGRTHFALKQYEEAKQYFEQALAISTAQRDSLGIAQTLGNIGVEEKQLEDYEAALKTYTQSLTIARLIHQNRAAAYNVLNIGLIYRELGDYDQSEQYLLQGLDELTELGDTRAISMTYANLGKLYVLQKQYQQALDYAQKGEELAQKLGAKYELRNVYESYMKAHAGLNDYAQAYAYQRLYIQVNDSLVNEANVQRIQELEAKYENEKKEKEIALLDQERSIQKTTILRQQSSIRTRNGIIGGVLLALALAAVATNNYRQKQQIAKQEKELEYQKRIELQNQQKLLMLDAMIEGQEKERRRVAKDLHDGIGSQLAALKIQIGSAGGESTNHTLMQRAYENAGNAYEEVRRVAHNMMPQTLLHKGLIPAIQELLQDIRDTQSLKIHWALLGATPIFRPNEEIMVYRILQELLHNILKHAHSTEVWVQLSEEAHHHVLMVEDDGKGFDPNTSPKGLGLASIESRIEYLNGELVIDSAEDRGTSIHLYIPKT